MDQLFTFVAAHWQLFAALAVILAMIFYTYSGHTLRGYKSATPMEATHLLNREDALLIDVREDNEFQQGHILGARHVPLRFLSDRLKELEKYRERPVIVSCRSGQRSARAATTLKKHGFSQVYNLAGGVTAWQEASLPLTRKK